MRRGSATYVLRPRRWWRTPWELVRVQHRRRTAIPAPWIYLAVLGLGVAGGLAGDRLVGIPWPLLPLAGLVLVWLGFVATGIGQRQPESLRDELIGTIRPRWRTERMAAVTARAFREPALPLYAVSGWPGIRSIGGISWRGDRVTSLSLAFFPAGFETDRNADTPQVRVDTSTRDGWPGREEEELRRELVHLVHRPSAEPGRRPERHNETVETVAGKSWRVLVLPVDGVPVPFRMLSLADAWVAAGSPDGHPVWLRAAGLPPTEVALERVTDVEPYLSGQAQLSRTWSAGL